MLSRSIVTTAPTRRTVSRRSIAALACATAVSVAACESKSEPSPTVSDLVIAGPNTLPIGQTAGYTATARYSDGSSSAGTCAVSIDGRTMTLPVEVAEILMEDEA